VLREILSELDNNMSDEELDQMIDEIDADWSGTVDFDGELNLENYLESWLKSCQQGYNDLNLSNAV